MRPFYNDLRIWAAAVVQVASSYTGFLYEVSAKLYDIHTCSSIQMLTVV